MSKVAANMKRELKKGLKEESKEMK